MNTATKKKRQVTPAQELKKELKKQYPDLIVSCKSERHGLRVEIKNLHDTQYRLSEIDNHCKQRQKVDRCEYTGEILLGGNFWVSVYNEIPKEKETELEKMFFSYLHQWDNYKHIKDVNCRDFWDLHYTHKDLFNKLLANEAYSELKEPITEPKQEEKTMIISTEQPKEADLDQDLLTIRVEITKRERLLDYLKQNGINGKIQQATEEEIKELKEKLDKHEQELIKTRIKNSHDFICDEAKKMLDALSNNDCEAIENCLKEIAFLNNDLKQDLDKLASITEESEEATTEVTTIDPDFSPQIETEKPELVLTAPPTIDTQNVIELFPKKKTLDQLRKELNTPEKYQDLLNNFDSYCKQYDNLTLHGLQLIRDDYSTKDANGELKPTYDQWFKFMQSYEELTNKLRKNPE